MMKQKIGEAAGLVWETLKSKNEIGLTELPRVLKLKTDITYQALGWLAREDKIHYRAKAGKIYVSLVEKEREVQKVGR
jgi:hypothetical protein